MKKGDKIVVLKDCPRLDYNDNTFVAAWKGDEGEYIGLANGTMHFCLVGKQCIKLRESEFEVVNNRWRNGDYFALDNCGKGKNETWFGVFIDIKELKAFNVSTSNFWYWVPLSKIRKLNEDEERIEFGQQERKDPIVEGVVSKFRARSKVGIEKYGTTLEENNTDDFFEHLQDELMDAILYLQKIKKIRREQLLTEIIKEDEKDGLYDADNTREEGLPAVFENVD